MHKDNLYKYKRLKQRRKDIKDKNETKKRNKGAMNVRNREEN